VTNAFGGRAPPGPAGGSFSASPDSLAAIGGGDLILRGRGAEGTEKGRGKERGRNRERRVRGGDCLLFI